MILHHGRTTGFAFFALVATTLLAVYTANAYPTPRAFQDVAARPSDNAVAQPESTVLLEVVAAREPSMDLNLLSHDTIKARNPCMNCECEEDCPAMCCPQKTAAAAERSISDNIVADALALTMATPPLELRGPNCIECYEGEDKPQAGPPNCCPQNHTHGHALILDNYQGTTLERAHLSISTELAVRDGEAAKTIESRDYCDLCECELDCPNECCVDQRTVTARIDGEAVKRAEELFDRALLSNELAVRGQAAQDIKGRGECDGCDCNYNCPLTCCTDQAGLTARIAGAAAELVKDDYAGNALLWTELATREHEAEDIDIRDNCDGCACDGDCPATCCEGETTATARIAGKVVIDTVENLERHLVSTELANRGEQATEKIKARGCEGCLDLDSSLACPGWCPPACCPGQATTERRIAGKVAEDAAKRDLQGHALLATELAIPGDQQEKTAEISARACVHCSCEAGDCPEECCTKAQTTTTARFAGKMVAGPQEDPEGDAILSIELAFPGDQKKTAELKARDICLGCTCDADCPEICCEGQTRVAARIDGVAAHSVKGAVTGVEDGHHLARTELAVPRDQENAAEMEARDLWRRYCENCDCEVDCPLECCGSEMLVTERIAGKIVAGGATGDLEDHHFHPSSELTVRGEEIMETRTSDDCENCSCDGDCPAQCCPPEQTIVVGRLAGEVEAPHLGGRGDYDVDDGLAVSAAFAVRDEETVDMRACGGCSCGHTNCPTWCCGEEITATARIADVAPIVEGGMQGLEERHNLLASTELADRGQEMVKPDSCGGCDCEEGDCPVACCGEATTVTARISEPAAEGAEDHHPRASAKLTVRGQETVKPDNCPSCVCGEADCPTECCGQQEIVAARIAAESADLESTGIAARGEKKAVEIKGGAVPNNCPSCVCGEADCPTECCGEEATVLGRLAGEVVVAHEAAAEEVLEDRHHHHTPASTELELVAREDETMQTRDCTNCICDEQECPALCCPAKVPTTDDGDVDVVKVLSSVEGRAEQEG